MGLILDTGPIVAALNAGDPDHDACAHLLTSVGEALLLPSTVLVEVDYWVLKLGGTEVWSGFIDEVAGGTYTLVHPTEGDLVRAAEIETAYADLDIGLVDASVVALCERLGETKVATLDHRDFSLVRPRHCERLQLWPAERPTTAGR